MSKTILPPPQDADPLPRLFGDLVDAAEPIDDPADFDRESVLPMTRAGDVLLFDPPSPASYGWTLHGRLVPLPWEPREGSRDRLKLVTGLGWPGWQSVAEATYHAEGGEHA